MRRGGIGTHIWFYGQEGNCRQKEAKKKRERDREILVKCFLVFLQNKSWDSFQIVRSFRVKHWQNPFEDYKWRCYCFHYRHRLWKAQPWPVADWFLAPLVCQGSVSLMESKCFPNARSMSSPKQDWKRQRPWTFNFCNCSLKGCLSRATETAFSLSNCRHGSTHIAFGACVIYEIVFENLHT